MRTQATPRIQISEQIPELDTSAALAVCLTEDGKGHPALPAAVRFNVINEVLQSGEFEPKEGNTLVITIPQQNAPRSLQLFLIGCGKSAELKNQTVTNAAGTAVRLAREHHCNELVLVPPPFEDGPALAQFTCQGALLGLYENDFYQQKEDPATALEHVTFVMAGDSSELQSGLERGRIVAESMNWARELVDEPGASLPPREFARRAQEMAEEFGLKVESLSAAEIRAHGMGGLWGVGKGSAEEPVMIVVRYEPDNADDEELWAFVGKGITFDTGGISIKPANGMEEMKSDMAGGAAALGAMRAIAQLKPRKRIIAIVPSAENMPSGGALKPGDVIKTLAGYSIEAVDTDAEGRLVLVDGIAYAKQLGASRIVDLATLTGSIIVALGDHYAGLFSNNDEWAAKVKAAASIAGERVWRMPVSDDYKKLIESAVADFKNYGGRPDATGAALLLSKFSGDTPWVHLDIAATAWRESPEPYAPKGATGAGIPTLVELALGMDGTAPSTTERRRPGV
jgi:leucyl aminopeptidase